MTDLLASHCHESWWLIEATFAPAPLYYAGHRRDGKGPNMTVDAGRAARFPDNDGALYTICHLLGIPVGMGATLEHMGYRVTEHIFDYTLPLQQKEEGPTCHCEACDPIRMETDAEGHLHSPNMRMIVCAICGNKRCPHAANHRNACTDSNEPGQPGSSCPRLALGEKADG